MLVDFNLVALTRNDITNGLTINIALKFSQHQSLAMFSKVSHGIQFLSKVLFRPMFFTRHQAMFSPRKRAGVIFYENVIKKIVNCIDLPGL